MTVGQVSLPWRTRAYRRPNKLNLAHGGLPSIRLPIVPKAYRRITTTAPGSSVPEASGPPGRENIAKAGGRRPTPWVEESTTRCGLQGREGPQLEAAGAQPCGTVPFVQPLLHISLNPGALFLPRARRRPGGERCGVRGASLSGFHIRTVQELLGHRSVQTTMIYTHVLNRGGRGVQSPRNRL